MAPVSRRTMLSAAAAAGSIFSAGDALAQANPQPIRGNRGGTDPGPSNPPIDRENPDSFASLPTDVGYVPRSMGHCIENTGSTPVRYLECLPRRSTPTSP